MPSTRKSYNKKHSQHRERKPANRRTPLPTDGWVNSDIAITPSFIKEEAQRLSDVKTEIFDRIGFSDPAPLNKHREEMANYFENDSKDKKTIYVKTGKLTVDQFKVMSSGIIQIAATKIYKFNGTRISKKHKCVMPTSRKGATFGYAYLRINDDTLYNYLLGYRLDGTTRACKANEEDHEQILTDAEIKIAHIKSTMEDEINAIIDDDDDISSFISDSRSNINSYISSKEREIEKILRIAKDKAERKLSQIDDKVEKKTDITEDLLNKSWAELDVDEEIKENDFPWFSGEKKEKALRDLADSILSEGDKKVALLRIEMDKTVKSMKEEERQKSEEYLQEEIEEVRKEYEKEIKEISDYAHLVTSKDFKQIPELGRMYLAMSKKDIDLEIDNYCTLSGCSPEDLTDEEKSKITNRIYFDTFEAPSKDVPDGCQHNCIYTTNLPGFVTAEDVIARFKVYSTTGTIKHSGINVNIVNTNPSSRVCYITFNEDTDDASRALLTGMKQEFGLGDKTTICIFKHSPERL